MSPIELKVLCEGASEQYFVAQVLGPHLRTFNIYARAEYLVPGRGGIVSFEKFYHHVSLRIGKLRPHQFVTTMIDLYRIGSFPEAEPQAGESAARRVQRIEAAMRQRLNHANFIPYIQIHEFEALVLVDPDRIPAQFPDMSGAEPALSRLKRDIRGLAPEDVDDGPQTAPSKRILKEFPDYARMKASAGALITRHIGMEQLRKSCPHFGVWVARLEALGS